MKLSKILSNLETTRNNLKNFLDNNQQDCQRLESELHTTKVEGDRARKVHGNLSQLLGDE